MTQTTTVTLTDFLLARIAEDEAVAQAAGAGRWHVDCYVEGADWLDEDERAAHLASPSHQDECAIEGPHMRIYDEGGHSPEQAQHIALHDPARVLAECEAKRRIVEQHEGKPTDSMKTVLRLLTLPYADHPDFREEWRA